MNEPNQQSFGQRTTELRKEAGLPQKQLAEHLGVSITSVQNYESGRIPNGEILVKLAAALRCTSEWLVNGEGEMRRGAAAPVQHGPTAAPQQDSDATVLPMPAYNGTNTLECFDCELMLIPLVEARLSAGNGSFETSADSDRRYAFRSDFLRRKGNPKAMVLMRVAGDSMEPEIKDNDVVLIDTANIIPRPGRLFAVSVEDMVYLKKVDAEPGKLILNSANPAYAPLEIDARGDLHNGIRIIGKAVWVGRELD